MDDCYNSDTICWIAESPLDDMVPCNYLYATGAIGLCLQVLIGLLPVSEAATRAAPKRCSPRRSLAALLARTACHTD